MTEKLTVECVAFFPLRKNTLVGFAAIHIPAMKLTVNDVAIHTRGEATWAQLPSKPQIRDDRLVRNAEGKAQYSPILQFDSPGIRNAFSQAVVRAVLEFDPAAFDPEDGE